MSDWDLDYLALAKFWALRKSKDPSTKVGSVIADPQHRQVGLGYNGFPRGVVDSKERYAEREVKYKFVVHAEANAILNATKSVQGCTLYVWPQFPCAECAKLIIQSGITCVVCPMPSDEAGTVGARWEEQTAAALTMFGEAGVTVKFLELHE